MCKYRLKTKKPKSHSRVMISHSDKYNRGESGTDTVLQRDATCDIGRRPASKFRQFVHVVALIIIILKKIKKSGYTVRGALQEMHL